MEKKEISKVMAWLAEKMQCPLCLHAYDFSRFRVLPRQSPLGEVVAHTNCLECGCALMFALDIKEGEIYLSGIVTDLTLQDALKFRNMTPISVDEVLDWRQFWQRHEGDLVKVLSFE